MPRVGQAIGLPSPARPSYLPCYLPCCLKSNEKRKMRASQRSKSEMLDQMTLRSQEALR
jgi:hypothetical protein